MKLRYLVPLLVGIALGCALVWGLVTRQQNSVTSTFAMAGNKVPEFQLRSLHGDMLDNALFQPSWRLLNVWASWCSPCKSEHAFLMALAARDVPIIGLNARDAKSPATEVLLQTGNPYQTVIFDPKGELALDLGSIVTPETYLIDGDGTLVFRHRGVLTEEIWHEVFLPQIAAIELEQGAGP